MAAPQAYANDQKDCVTVEGPGYGGYGCRAPDSFVAGVYIRGQEPGSNSPGSPGSYRPAQPIDCSSVGNVPTLATYWLYNYCNGTNWRPGPSGMLWDCSTIVGLTGDSGGLGLLDSNPQLFQDYLSVCMPEQRPPSPGQEQPEQRCYDQAKDALRPPRPQIGVNPQLGLTGLKSYFWLTNYADDMRLSRSFPVSCAIGEWRAVSGHLDAQVVRYLWDFGDGWGMTTTTPGAAWPQWLSEVHHTYERSSLQQPDQKYLVRVWAFWQGSFTLQAERERCVTGQDGRQQCTTERRTFGPYDLGEIYIVGRLRYPVQQAQSVIVDPGHGQ